MRQNCASSGAAKSATKRQGKAGGRGTFLGGHLHVSSPARVAVDVQVRAPRRHPNQPVLVVAVASEIPESADLVRDHLAELGGHGQIERGPECRRRRKHRGAPGDVVNGQADGTEAMQALGIPVVPRPPDLWHLTHFIVCLRAFLLQGHPADHVTYALGGGEGHVAEWERRARRIRPAWVKVRRSCSAHREEDQQKDHYLSVVSGPPCAATSHLSARRESNENF